MKGNKGITLIALVVTIIVLLILAGVAIAMLTGDNSILKRAQSTKAYNTLGAAKDRVSLVYNAAYAEMMRQKYDDATAATAKTTHEIFFEATTTNSWYKDSVNKLIADETKYITSGTPASGEVLFTLTPGATGTVKLTVIENGVQFETTGTFASGDTTNSSFSWSAITESEVSA